MTAVASAVERSSPAPLASPAQAGRFYAPELDVLRLLAFLMVFCRHVTNGLGYIRRDAVHASQPQLAAAGTQGFSLMQVVQGSLQAFDFGVCLFFFLSAFLITRLLLLEKETTGTVGVRNFYLRRILRIWPLYFFFLALIFLLSHPLPYLHVSGARYLAAVLFVSNVAAVLGGWQGLAIQPLWSISVEEQFYLVWPWFARAGRQVIILLSLVFMAIALATMTYFGKRAGIEVTAVWPNTLVQAIFLSGGALTACISFPERRVLSGAVRLAMLGLGSVLWVVASAGLHVVRFASPGALSLVGGYLLILAGTALIFNGVAGWRGRPIPLWLVHSGRISYGLYVFHVACLMVCEHVFHALFASSRVSPYLVEFSSALPALALTFGCAWLSYRYLERPFLRLKDRFTVVRSRPA